jgi:hypothetical protein
MKEPMDTIFRFLASLRLAVILLLGFVILLSIATFYESYTSTPQAQQVIYKTLWFDLLLFLLGVNVLCSALIRWPWKIHHAGFVITHVGILIILFGAVITRKFGVEGQIILREGEQTDAISINEPTLSFSNAMNEILAEYDPWFLDKPIPRGKEIRYDLGDTGVTCYVSDYFTNPQVVETISNTNPEPFPAIQLSLMAQNAPGKFTEWLFSNHPQRATLHLNIATIQFHQTFDESTTPPVGSNHLDVYVHDAHLHYRSIPASGNPTTGAIEIGKPFDPGWGMVSVQIDRFYETALINEKIIDGGTHNHANHSPNNPLIKFRLEKGSDNIDGYASYNTPKTMTIGSEQYVVNFGRKSVPIGFTLQLLDFRAPRYPGTNRPASFESDVKVVDAANQFEHEQRIFMNNPLYYNNFVVYQSSYIEGKNGSSDISIFSVARAPGTPIIYFGSIVMVLGMIIIVYQKAKQQTNGNTITFEE